MAYGKSQAAQYIIGHIASKGISCQDHRCIHSGFNHVMGYWWKPPSEESKTWGLSMLTIETMQTLWPNPQLLRISGIALEAKFAMIFNDVISFLVNMIRVFIINLSWSKKLRLTNAASLPPIWIEDELCPLTMKMPGYY